MPQFRGELVVKKNIDRVIFSYIVQIFVIIGFVIGSYFIFTNNRMAELGQIAHAYDTMNIDLMTNYVRDDNAVLTTENLLAKGTLAVKNPNKRSYNAVVNLRVSKNAKLNTVVFKVNGNELNTDNAEIKEGYYVINVENGVMDAFEDRNYTLEIEGSPYYTAAFDYVFEVKESL